MINTKRVLRCTNILFFVLLTVTVFPAAAIRCAGTSELQKAKLTASINKDVVVMTQKAAAIARSNYLDAVETGFEPEPPYLNDEQWKKFLELESAVVVAQDIYIDALVIAEKYEPVDEAKFEFYLDVAKENWESLQDMVSKLQQFLGELGVDAADMLGGE